MKRLLLAAATLSVFSFAPFALAEEWADLQMTFVLKGKAPEAQPVKNNTTDPFCSKLTVLSEKLLVNSKNNGIQNMEIYVEMDKSPTKSIHPDLKNVEPKTLVLDNKNCVYTPHVLIARPGQTIKATNSDNCGHNFNFSFLENDPLNFTVPTGGSKDVTLAKTERQTVSVACNIHSWMSARLLIFDHPYAAFSNADGVLKIEKLPVGKVAFRALHEAQVGAIDDVVINGKKDKWTRGRFELTLKPGMNDLGKVELDSSKLKP